MTGAATLLPVKKHSAYIERMATPDLLTAEDLLALNIQDKRTELVRGRLIVREPAGFRHGVIAMELARRLADFVKTHALGVVVAAETGFTLARNPDTVRAPDVGFIQATRVPRPLPRGYAEIAPDLAAEVLCHPELDFENWDPERRRWYLTADRDNRPQSPDLGAALEHLFYHSVYADPAYRLVPRLDRG